MPFHFVCPQYSENVTVCHVYDPPGHEAPGVVHVHAAEHAAQASLPDQRPKHGGEALELSTHRLLHVRLGGVDGVEDCADECPQARPRHKVRQQPGLIQGFWQ